ncbi:MAG: hypothetical protein ACC619_11260 [Paracoccaceae bacterium]
MAIKFKNGDFDAAWSALIAPHGIDRDILVLTVGGADIWDKTSLNLPGHAQIRDVAFEQIDHALIRSLKPDLVVSPLFWATFDCVELAQALQDAGFNGRYRVLAAGLPDPKMVLADVRTLCPQLDVNIIVAGVEAGYRMH